MSDNSRHIMSFENGDAIQNALNNGVIAHKYVAYDESASTIDWDSKTINYAAMPLTFQILTSGAVYHSARSTRNYKTFQYRVNDGEWTSVSVTATGTTYFISVSAGDKVQFRGDNAAYGTTTNQEGFSLHSTADFNIYGNVMSLINSTNFSGLTSFTAGGVFQNLFKPSFEPDNHLKDVSNLVLPATSLTQRCYSYMFNGNNGLTGKAPELPATTLANYCYASMFGNCTNLNYIKCLATDISATSCTSYWVGGVQTTSGTFVKNASMSSWTTGNNGIPANWTVQDA